MAVVACLFTPTGVGAQLHENISVEGKYVPDIIRIDKINTFPSSSQPNLPTEPIPYETGSINADFPSTLVLMPALGWRSTRTLSPARGYVDFSLGSWLNSNLSAGGKFIDTGTTKAGASLQFNSTSLWKPKIGQGSEDIKRWRYDGALSLYCTHTFKGIGELSAAADYCIGYFNYYGYYPDADGYNYTRGKIPTEAPTQTFNQVAARIGWRNIPDAAPLSWRLDAGVRHSAYRALYLPKLSQPVKGDRETMIYLQGGVNNNWDNGSSIGADAEGNLILFADAGKPVMTSPFTGFDAGRFTLSRPDNYGQISITPYYSFQKWNLNIRLGAEVDFTFNAGEYGNRFPVFHIAPDVRVDFRKGGFAAYLHALGGNELRTLSRDRELDYYAIPALSSTRPVYTPLDATLGIGIGPFGGFSAELTLGYKISRGLPIGGWYQTMLNTGFIPLAGLNTTQQAMAYSLDPTGLNLQGMCFRLTLDYKPIKQLELNANASFQPQSEKTGYFNGLDRPRHTVEASVIIRPVDKLRISLGYEYRGGRRIFTQWYSANNLPSDGGMKADIDIDRHQEFINLKDINLLNASVAWKLTDTFTIHAEANNLLNRRETLLPGLPSEGVVVTGGLSVIF